MTKGVAITKEEKEARKQKALDFFEKVSFGTFSGAFGSAGIANTQAYEWLDEDPEWKKKMNEARARADENGGDFAESKLMAHIKGGNLDATKFYLSTKHKTRGYVRQQQISGPNDGAVQLEPKGAAIDAFIAMLAEQARERD